LNIQILITAGPSGGTYTGTIVGDVEAGTAEPGAAAITGIEIASGHDDLAAGDLNKVYPGGIDSTGSLYFNPGGGSGLLDSPDGEFLDTLDAAAGDTVEDVELSTEDAGNDTEYSRRDHQHRIANQGAGNFRKVLQVDSSGDIVADWVRAS
tara:strand:+ start:1666 stop:2118 length:453 start_codon:yes stop_codon:yes gene_type:complete